MLRKAYEICDSDTRGAERTRKEQKLFFSVCKASQSTWACRNNRGADPSALVALPQLRTEQVSAHGLVGNTGGRIYFSKVK